MRIFIAIAALFFGLLIIAAISCFSGYVSGNQIANGHESTIKYMYSDDEQALANHTKNVLELIQVPKLQADLVKQVIVGANEARYGMTGSQATMQWIKEQNPNLPPDAIMKAADQIQVGNTDFMNRQTKRLDRCRAYEYDRNLIWTGFWIRIAGWPKDAAQLTKWCTAVTSEYAQNAFKTGKAEALQLR